MSASVQEQPTEDVLAAPPGGSDAYDFFLAHASADKAWAEELYDLLQPHCRVFLDSRSLGPGDNWPLEIPRAQGRALITVVLLSSASERAHYEQVEIATAIRMFRLGQGRLPHRVVPVVLDPDMRDTARWPYGLGSLTGLDARTSGGVTGVAKRLRELLTGLVASPAREERIEQPFRLLSMFRREDARLFFGRELVQRDLAALVEKARLVVLHGASGTGKSSLLHAGLRPLVEHRFFWVDLTPGANPLAALEQGAREACARAGIEQGETVAESLLAISRATHRPVLLVIDQAEELFQHQQEASLAASAQALAGVLEPCLMQNAAAGEVHVLLGVRDDCFGQLSYLRQAGLPVFTHEMLLRPLDRTGTQLAIEEPLRLAGYDINPLLVERLLQYLTTENGEVNPVELEIVCHELLMAARTHKNRRIELQLYDAMGGTGQVLATYLRRALGNIPRAAQEPSLRVLAQMLGRDGTRQPPMSQENLATLTGEAGEQLGPILDALVDLRLIEAGSLQEPPRTACFRIAHDLVAKEVFERLGAREKADLAVREKLNIRLHEWNARGRKRLRNRDLTSQELGQFLEWGGRKKTLPHEQAEFLAAVRRLDRFNTWRIPVAMVSALVILLVGLLFGLVAFITYSEALAQRAEARAERELLREPGHTMTWLREAVRQRGRIRPDHYFLARDAAQAGIGYVLGDMGKPNGMFGGDAETILAFSPGPKAGVECPECWPRRRLLLVARTTDSMGLTSSFADLYDLEAGRWHSQLRLGEKEQPLVGAAFLANGATVMVATKDGSLHLWDLEHPASDPAEATRVIRADASVSFQRLIVSPGSQHVAVLGSRDDTRILRVWETSGWTHRDHVLPDEMRFDHAMFAADDRVILATGYETSLYGLLLDTGRWLTLAPDFVVTEMVMPSRNEVVLAGRQGPEGPPRLQFLQMRPGKAPPSVDFIWGTRLQPSKNINHLVALASDHLMVWNTEGEVHEWVQRDGRWAEQRLSENKERTSPLALDASRGWLATGYFNGAVELTDLTTHTFPPTRKLLGHSTKAQRAAFSPDGHWLATADTEGQLRLWPLMHGLTRSLQYSDLPLGSDDEPDTNRAIEEDEEVARRAAWSIAYCGFERSLRPGEPMEAPDSLMHLPDRPTTGRSPDLPACLASGQAVLRAKRSVFVAKDGQQSPTRLVMRDAEITALSVSEDGHILAIAWKDQHIETWSGEPLTLSKAFSTQEEVHVLAVANDGSLVASNYGAFGGLKKYSRTGEERPVPFYIHHEALFLRELALSGDGRLLALSGIGTYLRWEWDQETHRVHLPGDDLFGALSCRNLRFSGRGQTLLMAVDGDKKSSVVLVPLPPRELEQFGRWLEERARDGMESVPSEGSQQRSAFQTLDAAGIW